MILARSQIEEKKLKTRKFFGQSDLKRGEREKPQRRDPRGRRERERERGEREKRERERTVGGIR